MGIQYRRERTELLEQAGWKRGPDGIRAKDGKQLKLVFQTSTNAPRQKTQAIVKQACQKAGIEVELKSVTASVYFSSDVANPDTTRKFYADIQMYTIGVNAPPDPEGFMRQFLSSEIAAKENKWQGRNVTRWRNEAYDQAFRAAEGELDPVKRAALFIAHERHGGRRRGGHPHRISPASLCVSRKPQGDPERLGQHAFGTCRTGTARRDSARPRYRQIIPVRVLATEWRVQGQVCGDASITDTSRSPGRRRLAMRRMYCDNRGAYGRSRSAAGEGSFDADGVNVPASLEARISTASTVKTSCRLQTCCRMYAGLST